jgi:thymidine phosphorylase
LVKIGTRLGRRMSALITDMSQPLGLMVGNALEVREAIDTLKGRGPEDLETLSCELGAELLLSSGRETDHGRALAFLEKLLREGEGLQKFAELLRNQGGDVAVIDDPARLPAAPRRVDVPAPRSGVVASLDALGVGRGANLLGAGRFTKTDRIDPAVGVELRKKVGHRVARGEPLAVLHVNDPANLDQVKRMVAGAFVIGDGAVAPPPLIVERIGP